MTQDTNIETVEILAEVLRIRSPKNSNFDQIRACEALLDLAAERDALAVQLTEVRNAVIDDAAFVARFAFLSRPGKDGYTKEEADMCEDAYNRILHLKSSPKPAVVGLASEHVGPEIIDDTNEVYIKAYIEELVRNDRDNNTPQKECPKCSTK
jgi:hypothetical protein